jgi:hypothetical protein
MAFYAFTLSSGEVKFQRGKIPDNDLLTFLVKVNEVVRGKGVGVSGSLVSGGPIAYPAIPVNTGSNIRVADVIGWIIGPLDIASGDQISVIYSGTNISDTQSQLDAQKQGEVEVKLLDTLTSAVVGAVGGPIASAVGAALGFIGDPIGKFLGFTKEGPCNGPVFSDAVQFTGAGLNNLPFQPQFAFAGVFPPGSSVVSFTNGSAGDPGPSYTDEATHDSSTCGHIAETDVTFEIWKLPPFISVRFWAGQIIGIHAGQAGLRRFGSPPFSLRSRLGIAAQ